MQDTSEVYRKYVVKLLFNNNETLYSIWGTDMSTANQTDQLLIYDNRLITFTKIEDIKNRIREFESSFFDKENFISWIDTNNFLIENTVYDLYYLEDVNTTLLANKEYSLAILGNINIIEDFCIQLEHCDKARLFNDNINVLKEYIYTNFFWKENDKSIHIDSLDLKMIKADLSRLYSFFHKSILVVT